MAPVERAGGRDGCVRNAKKNHKMWRHIYFFFTHSVQEKMHLTLPVHDALKALVGPAIVHGFADLRKPTRELWPYITLIVPVPSTLTTVAFACASIVHFARDVGVHASVVLHSVLVGLALAHHADWATAILLLFMNLVHVPRRVGHDHVVVAACGFAAAAMIAMPPCDAPPDVAQKLVVAHVVVNDVLPNPDDAIG